MKPRTKFVFTPAPLPPIRMAAPSPSPRILPAIVAAAMIFSILVTMIGLAANGVGLVEW